jgi:hypothetical protein
MSYIYPDRVVNALTLTGAVAATNGNNFDTATGKGLIVVVDITAITAGSMTVTVEGFDEISGKYYTLLTSAALAAAATTVLRIYPGLTAAANVTVSDVTPAKCRVRVAIVTGPVTATIAAHVIE